MKLAPAIGYLSPKLEYRKEPVSAKDLQGADAVLCVALKGESRLPLPSPAPQRLAAGKNTCGKDEDDGHLEALLDNGTYVASVCVDPAAPIFAGHEVVRKALNALLKRKPRHIVAAFSSKAVQSGIGTEALYVLIANCSLIDTHKTDKKESTPGCTLHLHGLGRDRQAEALGENNVLARALINAPGNALPPSVFEGAIRRLGKSHALACKSLTKNALRKAGANAFLAVADSTPHPAFIVRLDSPRPQGKLRIALVGKGVCFDTGGYNLKSGSGMRDMHGDMAGAAVALSAMLALTKLRVPVELECWLGLAENHISPEAIRPGDVVRAHSGKTIEIVDTDAEGRLILSDLLSLATRRPRKRPDVAITFATLTGTMVYSLGKRYSGMFATNDEHADLAVAAGRDSGERVCQFPMDKDYHAGLKSKVADILQCSRDPNADHIMAARFLGEFVHPKTSWVHVDLAAASCPGGLGAIASDTTGFGVRWTVDFVQKLAGAGI